MQIVGYHWCYAGYVNRARGKRSTHEGAAALLDNRGHLVIAKYPALL
jgi:hypothetical protein